MPRKLDAVRRLQIWILLFVGLDPCSGPNTRCYISNAMSSDNRSDSRIRGSWDGSRRREAVLTILPASHGMDLMVCQLIQPIRHHIYGGHQ